MRLIDADALRNVKAPSICWLCGNHAQLSISDLVDNAPNVPRIAELQAEVERLKAEQGCEDGECRLALMAEVEALREENDLLGQPAPIATLRAEVERLNSMLKMKQDDWIAACKEAEQAEAELERLKKVNRELLYLADWFDEVYPRSYQKAVDAYQIEGQR